MTVWSDGRDARMFSTARSKSLSLATVFPSFPNCKPSSGRRTAVGTPTPLLSAFLFATSTAPSITTSSRLKLASPKLGQKTSSSGLAVMVRPLASGFLFMKSSEAIFTHYSFDYHEYLCFSSVALSIFYSELNTSP
ncbi:Uncharacterised protein [Candidatus Gugararchaeum adminiculabundum]|nr:Uncharacterised protein [Candidatus Gugararchaeum adminiculabundum]